MTNAHVYKTENRGNKFMMFKLLEYVYNFIVVGIPALRHQKGGSKKRN